MLLDAIKYWLKTDRQTRAADRAQYKQLKRMCNQKGKDVTNAMCAAMRVGSCFWIDADETDDDICMLVPEKAYTEFCPHFREMHRCTCTNCRSYKLNKDFFDARDDYAQACKAKDKFWHHVYGRELSRKAK